MDYLHRNKIIYKRHPVSDQPTSVYPWGWYYENGTHEYYALFHSKSLITSYRSLKWHLYVLIYLNDSLTKQEFIDLALYISDRSNGFISFNIDIGTVDSIVKEVLEKNLSKPPNNRLRKVIFKVVTGLTKQGKVTIGGKLIGRGSKASAEDIYETMLLLHDKEEKITISKIAKILKVSTRTVYRNMTHELTKEKELLNEEI